MIVVYSPVNTCGNVPINQDYIRSFWIILGKLMQLDDFVVVL